MMVNWFNYCNIFRPKIIIYTHDCAVSAIILPLKLAPVHGHPLYIYMYIYIKHRLPHSPNTNLPPTHPIRTPQYPPNRRLVYTDYTNFPSWFSPPSPSPNNRRTHTRAEKSPHDTHTLVYIHILSQNGAFAESGNRTKRATPSQCHIYSIYPWHI